MLTKELCEKACLYLLVHCYEEKKNEDGTYEFTPSGFDESEIFKQLINEHFNSHQKIYELKRKQEEQSNEIKALWILISILGIAVLVLGYICL